MDSLHFVIPDSGLQTAGGLKTGKVIIGNAVMVWRLWSSTSGIVTPEISNLPGKKELINIK